MLMVRKGHISIFLIFVLILSVFSQGSANLLKTNEKKISALTGNRIIILVDDSIYESLSSELLVFINDIEKDGYEVDLYHKKLSSSEWGSPQKVRSFIKSHSEKLVGCILVGHIPMPKYRIKGYMNEFETFPCDYYYMDLDGDWEIYSDGNWRNGFYYTIFENHTAGSGDIEPEIWVGRLTPDYWVGDEITLLKDYFDRNHNYRTGRTSIIPKALLYIDDFKVSYTYNFKNNILKAYPNSLITVINNEEKTRTNNYMNKLKSGNFEWVELVAHSNNLCHEFIHNNGYSLDTLSVWDLKDNNTKSIFYYLFCCEALDYTNQCLGNTYIFGVTSGLVVIGTSKISGDGDCGESIYKKIGEGNNIGKAFKFWFEVKGIKRPELYMGHMIFGDPTLKPIKDTTSPEISINSPEVGCIYLMGKEILRINPTDKFDCIVIQPMDLEIEANDANSVKEVGVYVDSNKHFAEQIDEDIWSFPVINDNPNIPEVHKYIAEAKDLFGNVERTGERKICSIKGNSPPFVIQEIDGPISGKTGVEYNYAVKLFDVEGEDVYVHFNWGDGSESNWIGPIKAEAINPESFDLIESKLTTFQKEHEFEKSGNYKISVEVKDKNDNLGIYKATLDITIESKSRKIFIKHLYEFLENWDFLFLIDILDYLQL